MSFSNHVTRWAAIAVLLVCVLGLGAAPPAITQSDTPVLVVLDKDAIDYGPPPHFLPPEAVNTAIADVGMRDELAYFQSHTNAQVILTSAQNGNGGWFALKTVPPSWASEPDADDGLMNYVLAGPGLGSPDENGEREALLDNIPGVTPVRAAGLGLLVGRKVCAVVYQNDIVVHAGSPLEASLKGATLGRIAFRVLALIPTDDPSYPNVQIEVLESRSTCTNSLALLADAPIETP